ncbi:MAG: hypothetical protein ACOCTH_01670 [Halodesulfurarchaeum sp.]
MREHAPSNRLAVDQPTRGADRNKKLANRADPATDKMLLPSLEDGITLLDIDGDRGVPILQSIVLNHLLLNEGPALWIDADGHGTTTSLAQLAPSRRLLERIHIARGFTAAQHFAAVSNLPDAVDALIQASVGSPPNHPHTGERADTVSPHTPALIVAPAVDAQYRTADTLGETHAKTLQARTLARLATYAEGYDIPVLVTRNERNEFAEPVATVADHHLKCERTRMGPRVVGEDFETLVYPVDGGAYYQTTFAYWRQLLAARATQVGVEPTTPSPSTPTPEGVGTGVTADGETVTATADPLLDAWTASGTGGR